MSKAFDIPVASDQKSWVEQQKPSSDSFTKKEEGLTITGPIKQIKHR